MIDSDWAFSPPFCCFTPYRPLRFYCPLAHQNRPQGGDSAHFEKLWSNLRPVGSKCTVFKKAFVTLFGLFCALRSHLAPPAVIRGPGNCAPFVHTRCTPVHHHQGCQSNGKHISVRTPRMCLRGIGNLCSSDGYDQN